jgi:tetratricopeptide (TPR) repeat protein
MPKLSILRQTAIQAAKTQNWVDAAVINQEILQQEPLDVEAYNRLGLAQMQLKKLAEAKKTFLQVLKIDKSNIIANKHLKKLANNQVGNLLTFSDSYFIEEPGKTKIIDLHRLANKHTLNELSVGQNCKLIIKTHYICIETEDGVHIGALPEDLSARLTKLIHNGNEYSCQVHSWTEKTCKVLIKETRTSEKNAHLQSFPVNKTALTGAAQMSEDFILEDEIPIQLEDGDPDMSSIESALEKIDDFS